MSSFESPSFSCEVPRGAGSCISPVEIRTLTLGVAIDGKLSLFGIANREESI